MESNGEITRDEATAFILRALASLLARAITDPITQTTAATLIELAPHLYTVLEFGHGSVSVEIKHGQPTRITESATHLVTIGRAQKA